MLPKPKSSWIAVVITVAITAAIILLISASHNLLLIVVAAMVCFALWLVYNTGNAIVLYRRSVAAESEADRRAAVRRMWSNIFFAVIPFFALSMLIYFVLCFPGKG